MTIRKVLKDAHEHPIKDSHGREVIAYWKHKAIVEELKNEIKRLRQTHTNNKTPHTCSNDPIDRN